jgi:hypothetical protein
MRAPGTLIVYLVKLLLGFAFIAGAIWSIVTFGPAESIGAAWKGAIGLIVSGYSFFQIFRPVPRHNKPNYADDYDDDDEDDVFDRRKRQSG